MTSGLILDTYHFDNNIKLHQNSDGFDRKSIRCGADQSTWYGGQDRPRECRETGSRPAIVFQILSRWPKKPKHEKERKKRENKAHRSVASDTEGWWKLLEIEGRASSRRRTYIYNDTLTEVVIVRDRLELWNFLFLWICTVVILAAKLR